MLKKSERKNKSLVQIPIIPQNPTNSVLTQRLLLHKNSCVTIHVIHYLRQRVHVFSLFVCRLSMLLKTLWINVHRPPGSEPPSGGFWTRGLCSWTFIHNVMSNPDNMQTNRIRNKLKTWTPRWRGGNEWRVLWHRKEKRTSEIQEQPSVSPASSTRASKTNRSVECCVHVSYVLSIVLNTSTVWSSNNSVVSVQPTAFARRLKRFLAWQQPCRRIHCSSFSIITIISICVCFLHSECH